MLSFPTAAIRLTYVVLFDASGTAVHMLHVVHGRRNITAEILK